jgi:hypothetical protein
MKLAVITSDMFQQALSRLSEGKLPLAAALKLREINRVVYSKNKDFHEIRIGRLKSLAEKDEEGNPIIENETYKLSKNNLDMLQNEINKLLEQDVLVPKLSMKDIADIKDIFVAQHELAMLEGIIEE